MLLHEVMMHVMSIVVTNLNHLLMQSLEVRLHHLRPFSEQIQSTNLHKLVIVRE